MKTYYYFKIFAWQTYYIVFSNKFFKVFEKHSIIIIYRYKITQERFIMKL
jgi:hypothetical protein